MKIRLLATLVVSFVSILGTAQQYTIQYTEECQSIDLTPQFASNSEHTYLWDFGDGTQSTLHNPPPHTYLLSGDYIVCLTVFDAGTGLPINEPNCNLVPIPSCCEPLDVEQFWIEYGALITDCVTHTICVHSPPLFADEDYCIIWDFGDGTGWDQGSFADWDCVSHEYNCNGTFNLCATIYCCDDEANAITLCETIVVDCECTNPAGPFAISGGFSDCEYSATLFGGCDDYVIEWFMGDGSYYAGRDVSHTYWWPGTFDVCVTIECPNNAFPRQVICIEVENECECTMPPDAWSPLVFVPPEGLDVPEVCNTPVFIIESDFIENLDNEVNHCFVWDYGDGDVDTLDTYSVYYQWLGWQNYSIHRYQCNGIYDVCLTAFCCDDPSISETWCTQVEVDCPCVLQQQGLGDGFPGGGSKNPPDPQPEAWLFSAYTSMSECSLEAYLASVCPDDYCVEWDFDDGSSIQYGHEVAHEYQDSGVYEVCVTVTCCDEPNLFSQQCQEVTASCEACPEDLDGDGQVSTIDLLQMLAAFGSDCE